MGLGNDDAELIASYSPVKIEVIWNECDPELRALIAIQAIIEKAELLGHAVTRIGDYLSSLGKNKSFYKESHK